MYKVILVIAIAFQLFFSGVCSANIKQPTIDTFKSDIAYFQSYIDKNRSDELSPQLVDRLEFNLIQITSILNENNISDEQASDYSQLEIQTYELIRYFRPQFKARLSDVYAPIKNLKASGGHDALIKGTITDSITSEPIDNAHVNLYFGGNYPYASTYSNHDGIYKFLNLEPSGYEKYSVYVSAPGFSSQDITNISLDRNESKENIDFNLISVGSISGSVTDENGYPILAFISVLDEEFNRVTGGNNSGGENGSFQINVNDPGNYYLSIRAIDYTKEIYPNVPCLPDCDFSQAELITVNNNDIVLNPVKLTLNKNISGKILDQDTNQLIDNSIYQRVELIGANNGLVMTFSENSFFDEYGNWHMRGYPGEYYIRAYAQDYIAQYANLENCGGESFDTCDISLLTPTTYYHDNINDIENVRFYLDTGGKISGRILTPNLTLSNDTTVYLYDESGAIIKIITSEDGNYQFSGLGNGTYYLSARKYNYYPTAYPSQYCDIEVEIGQRNECVNIDAFASSVQISNLNSLNNIDIILKKAPEISGVVRDDNGQPLSGVVVRALIYDGLMRVMRSTTSDQFGVFELSDLYFTEFYLFAEYLNTDNEYHKELYADIACENYTFCNPQNATVLNLTQSSTYGGHEINLTKKAALTMDFSASQLGGYLKVFDKHGEFVKSSRAGAIRNTPLLIPAGEYHLVYEGDVFSNHVSKVYGGENCFQECNPLSGTIVRLQNNREYNFSMQLDQSFNLEVDLPEWDNEQYLEVYENDALIYREITRFHTKELSLNLNGRIKVGLTKTGYPYQFYNNVQCNNLDCAIALAEEVDVLPNDSKQITFDQILETPLTKIQGTVLNSTGQPMRNVDVELIRVGSTSSSHRVDSDELGQFSIEAIREGQYHVYASQNINYLTHVGSLYGGELCLTFRECNLANSTVINVVNNQYLENIDFSLPQAGTVQIENVQYADGRPVKDAEFWFYRWIDGRYQFDQAIDLINEAALIEDLSADTYKIMAVQRIHDNVYVKTVYPNVSCTGLDIQTCLNQGTDVDVFYDLPIVINDFVISQPATIKVHVQDSVSGEYLSDYKVKLHGSYVSSHYPKITEAEPLYMNVSHELQYYLEVVSSVNLPNKGKLYEGVNCYQGVDIDCQLEQGTHFQIDLGAEKEFFISLEKKPELELKIKDSITLEAIDSGVDLKLYDDTENLLFTNSKSHGIFTYNLSPGMYYFVAESNEHNIKAYPNSLCTFLNLNSCDSGYSNIMVVDDVNSAYNLFLDLKRGYTGFVLESESGLPQSGVKVDVWDYDFNDSRSDITGANGSFSIYAPFGSAYISTDVGSSSGLIDEIYDNISCYDGPVSMGLCDTSMATSELLFNTPLIVFELDKDEIFSHGFE